MLTGFKRDNPSYTRGRWLETVARFFAAMSFYRQHGRWPTVMNITASWIGDTSTLNKTLISCVARDAVNAELARQLSTWKVDVGSH